MNKPFLILFSIGAIFIMGFALYKSVHAEQSRYFDNYEIMVPTPVFAQPISDTLAYDMFMAYHQSSDPERSKGVLRTRDKAIIQFYIDHEQIIEPLKNKASALGKNYLGLSAIPGYNSEDDAHSLIWVAVVDADTGAGIVPELMLPQNGESWTDYIYNHGVTCPAYCPENSNWLWNRNWAE